MKQVIKGKMFDTEQSEEICVWQPSHGDSDSKRIFLMKSKGGRFFLFSKNASTLEKYGSKWVSKYGGANGQQLFTAEQHGCFVELSPGEAKKFMELHGTAENYESHFGPVEAA